MSPETREEKVRALETLLAELVKSMRSSFMYPPGHPALRKSHENAYRFLRDFFSRTGEFSITSEKEGIDYEETPLNRESEALKKLSGELNHKNIFRLTFRDAMTPEEFESFMSLISMDARKFREEGGAGVLFGQHGIKNIVVKEMEYDALLKEGGTAERTGAEKGDSTGAGGAADSTQGGGGSDSTRGGETSSAEPGLTLPHAPAEEEKDESEKELERCLSLLAAEVDPERFKKILLYLIRLADKFRSEDKADAVVRIAAGVAGETMPQKRRPEVLVKMCISAVRKCPTDAAIGEIVEGFSSRDEKEREVFRRLIRIIGESMIDPALTRLIESSDSQERRNLIGLLIGFGEAARPKLEIYLFDERWYVVRNMAVILGEIRSERSLNSLSRAVAHEDFRVQREVIKALTRIGGKRVSTFLLRLLPDAPEQLALIIINSLGVLGDASATEALVAIMTKKDPLHKNYELRKESIGALAKLRNGEAVEALGTILLKKEFFGGLRYEDLRISAARALGRIGGERSIELLTKASRLRNRAVGRAATAALAALGVHQ
jgi:HEAT repeat protein